MNYKIKQEREVLVGFEVWADKVIQQKASTKFSKKRS